jgi:LAO/AO transport system kinase
VVPAQDYDYLYEAGVKGIYGPGTPIPASAKDVLEQIQAPERMMAARRVTLHGDFEALLALAPARCARACSAGRYDEQRVRERLALRPGATQHIVVDGQRVGFAEDDATAVQRSAAPWPRPSRCWNRPAPTTARRPTRCSTRCCRTAGPAFRLGISGVPGVGKSTFIEALGLYLIAGRGHRVAVLAVDPVQRQRRLHPGRQDAHGAGVRSACRCTSSAYIRAQPQQRHAGRRGREDARVDAGVRGRRLRRGHRRDRGRGPERDRGGRHDRLFVLLQLPNAGDDLQAIKKGVMELADLVVINKADLDEAAATRARAQITSAALFGPARQPRPRLHHDDTVWHPQVLQISALQGRAGRLLGRGRTFRDLQTANGRLAARRQQQDQAWMWERIEAGLRQRFTNTRRARAAGHERRASGARGCGRIGGRGGCST